MFVTYTFLRNYSSCNLPVWYRDEQPFVVLQDWDLGCWACWLLSVSLLTHFSLSVLVKHWKICLFLRFSEIIWVRALNFWKDANSEWYYANNRTACLPLSPFGQILNSCYRHCPPSKVISSGIVYTLFDWAYNPLAMISFFLVDRKRFISNK